MKKINKSLSLLLAVLMAFSALSIPAFAEETTDALTDTPVNENVITVKMINYNVAGMPSFSGKSVSECQGLIAKYIVDNDIDIIAVQEDFGYHRHLVKGLTGYKYKSNHTGSIPGGDGLNIFTKDMTIYNEKREQWHQAFGSVSEGDLLTPKGLMYVAIDIGDGVIVDFYNIHADAFDTEGSREARYSNYMQLVTLIEQNYKKNNRPVIVTGDFNQNLHSPAEVNSNMHAIFHDFCKLKDAWVEIHNEGNYTDFLKWQQSGVESWGNWDSVEKFLYKDGGGVEVKAVDFKYTQSIKDSAGNNVSDHAAAEFTFEFTKTEAFQESTDGLWVVPVANPLQILINMIRWIFKDIAYIFSNFGELIDFLG